MPYKDPILEERSKKVNDYINKEHRLWRDARTRAKNDGLAFNIEQSDIIIPEYDPVLGGKLTKYDGSYGYKIPDLIRNEEFMQRFNTREKGESDPNAPSIDRIDPRKGYVKDNFVVTSWRWNNIKRDLTPEELKSAVLHYTNNDPEIRAAVVAMIAEAQLAQMA